MLFLALSSILPLTAAWGNLTHRTIAILASRYLTPAAQRYSLSLLGNEPIDTAATWADSYKFLPEGRSTSSWHFVDAHDDPPETCSVDYARDCRNERPCIITAISNMTETVNDFSATTEERTKAFKFLLHLLGDLHCPLHAEGLLRGGNDLVVLYEGVETNLHFVWDVLIPASRTHGWGVDEGVVAVEWATRLYNRGEMLGCEAEEEVLLGDDDDGGGVETWIVKMAREANAWVCRMVLQHGIEGVQGKELSGEYLTEAIPVVDEMVGKAGRRLAAWINELSKRNSEPKEELK